MKKALHKNCYHFNCSTSSIGAVVRTLISHQCDLVPIPDSVPQVGGGQEDLTFINWKDHSDKALRVARS